MNILTSLAQILRPTSKPEGVFVIRPGYDSLRILQEAEDWSLLTGIGAWVVFMPGVHEIRYTFEFFHIAKILGFGIGSTKLRRYGKAWLKSVRNYAEIAHAPEVSGFEIENMVETTEPAIELGSCQNAKLSEVYHWGAPADFLCVTNSERTETPPPGKPVGTWTENITIERVVVYGPKKAGIKFRVLHPQKKDQSFSYLRMAAQITLTEAGSVGIDFDSHCHAYGAVIHAKINMDPPKSIRDALKIGVYVGPECNITGCDWGASFIEGESRTFRDPDLEASVIRPAGYRIRVASSARVSGHGKFYRQRESHTPDDITPGVNYAGEQSGYVRGGVLEDEGI